MSVTLELHELTSMFRDVAELGAKNALMQAGLTKPTISQTKAYELYGRKIVERWVREGLIEPKKDGDKNATVRYDHLLLDLLSKSSNHVSFFKFRKKFNTNVD